MPSNTRLNLPRNTRLNLPKNTRLNLPRNTSLNLPRNTPLNLPSYPPQTVTEASNIPNIQLLWCPEHHICLLQQVTTQHTAATSTTIASDLGCPAEATAGQVGQTSMRVDASTIYSKKSIQSNTSKIELPYVCMCVCVCNNTNRASSRATWVHLFWEQYNTKQRYYCPPAGGAISLPEWAIVS